MADHEMRRLSFGRWPPTMTGTVRARRRRRWTGLIPAAAQAVLDLATGTGAVTRQLAGRAGRVIAVEPDERVRAILTARCPGPEVLAGRGENIPLPDASVDAVVILAAWHWLDDLPGMLGTYSGVITLEPDVRAGLIRRVQDWLDRQPWEQADLPLICRCLRSTRQPG